jgi:hypothetical protein
VVAARLERNAGINARAAVAAERAGATGQGRNLWLILGTVATLCVLEVPGEVLKNEAANSNKAGSRKGATPRSADAYQLPI